jgi:hypothetical protein
MCKCLRFRVVFQRRHQDQEGGWSIITTHTDYLSQGFNLFSGWRDVPVIDGFARICAAHP